MTMKQVAEDPRRGWTSASNAQADSLCPGRHMAQKTMGKDVPEERGEDADFGDQVHAAMCNGTDPTDSKVLFIVERMREIDVDLLLLFFGEDAGKVRAIRERRLWTKFTHKNWQLEHSGQIDVVYIHAGKALIVEYKSLAGDLASSPTNLQLRDQVVLTRGNIMINQIGTAVNQPMVEGRPKIAAYGKVEIDVAEDAMQKRVVVSNTPGQERNAGEEQCKFCTAKLKCPEYAKFTAALTPQYHIGDVPVQSWTPEMMLKFLKHRSIAEKWLKECHEFIKEEVRKNPALLPGWKLESGATRTKITDMAALWARLNEKGLSDDELIAAASIKMEHLEVLMRQATKAKGAALKKMVKQVLDGISTQKPDAPSLVREEEP